MMGVPLSQYCWFVYERIKAKISTINLFGKIGKYHVLENFLRLNIFAVNLDFPVASQN